LGIRRPGSVERVKMTKYGRLFGEKCKVFHHLLFFFLPFSLHLLARDLKERERSGRGKKGGGGVECLELSARKKREEVG
jgi:hypothetical protein